MAVNTHRWVPLRASVSQASSGIGRRELFIDAMIAVGLLVFSVLAMIPFPPPEAWGWQGWPGRLATFVVAFLPLAVRRVAPRAAHTLVSAGLLALALIGLPGQGNSTLVAQMVSTYSFSAYARTSHPWVGWPMAIAPIVVGMSKAGGFFLYVIPIACVELGIAWFFGSVQRHRAELAATLDHRALQLESDADEVERLAVSQERGRIARDLQALVAAAIDAMVAGAREARSQLVGNVEFASQVASRVAETGRVALQEMRRLLDVLRGRDEHLDGLSTLEALPALAADSRDAGVRVELSTAGDLGSIAVPSQRAAFRLVEEAVAMAGDRGGHGPLQVQVDAGGTHLQVSALWRGDGAVPPVPLAPFDPRIAALHERVALLGGELRTWLAEDGGFELETRLPIQQRPGDVLVRPLPISSNGEDPDRRATGIGRGVTEAIDGIRRRPWAQDLLVAVALGTVSIGEVLWVPEPFYAAEGSGRALLMVYLIAATLVLRRRAPMTALLTAGLLAVVHDLLALRWTNVMLLIFAIHVFTVASRRSRRMAVVAVLIASASQAIYVTRVATGAFRAGGLGLPVTAALTIVLLVGLRIFGMWIFAAFAGRTLAAREELNGRLAVRIRRLMEHRDMQARLAIADERRRVARELHDIVGHGLSVMVLQAGAVGSLLARDPDRAGTTLALIERLGTQAKQELDTLVDLLGPETTPATGPPRTIEELVADARSAGLDVDLAVEGHGDPDGPLALHAYRIVQEALTNAGKHAIGARVQVRLAFLDGAVEVEVVNDAPRIRPRAVVPGGGHGLVGMRERVGLFGGEFMAGPRPEGGFTVRARLPEPALT